MNQVHVPRVAREGEVVAVRKQRIERAERVVSGLVITRRCIDLEPQTRRPVEAGDGVPAATADRPGADALAADVTGLPHRFEVPVEAAARAGVSDVERSPGPTFLRSALTPPYWKCSLEKSSKKCSWRY